MIMRRLPYLFSVLMAGVSCISDRPDTPVRTISGFTATVTPIVIIHTVGIDTLSDSARIHRLQPEPDGGSVAFLFADPAKGVMRGLGLVEGSGAQAAQLAWPDSVMTFWWSGPHQLSFTARTGEGVRVVVDAHAAQLEALEVTGVQSAKPPMRNGFQGGSREIGLSRVQAFLDSIRIQPEGTPQGSALRYEADTILPARNDSLAAVHVHATDIRGTKVNPAWYLTHLPSGHVYGIDSLTGRSTGLPAEAGEWGADGRFYYAKERSIWRAEPRVH
jgi:hypothetical protein